jgi:hypothetical protein
VTVLDRLRAFWPHDDSPGFTDYPETDIQAHRSMARWNRRFAVVIFFGGLWYASTTAATTATGAVALALATSFYASANGMEVQALRWELQLERERQEDDDA